MQIYYCPRHNTRLILEDSPAGLKRRVESWLTTRLCGCQLGSQLYPHAGTVGVCQIEEVSS